MLNTLLNQIDKALDHDLFYLALAVSLAIPDICGALNSKNGNASRDRYENWFNQYVAPRYIIRGNISFTGADCYQIRSAMLQANTLYAADACSRIIFVEPAIGGTTAHNNNIGNALHLDVRLFCKDMVAGAREWSRQNTENPFVLRNKRRLVKTYSSGLRANMDGLLFVT
jgi:hypothetical protein